MLFEVVLAFEASAAHLATERQLGTLVGPLVDHQIIGFGELPLAVLADELVFGAHFSTELAPTDVVVDLYYRKHRARFLSRFLYYSAPDELIPDCVNPARVANPAINRPITHCNRHPEHRRLLNGITKRRH